MQKRQFDRQQYFNELATTSRKYFVPYIQQFKAISPKTNVIEIGCGDGGNLLPFSVMGCRVVGCDMATCRIDDAQRFFAAEHAKGEFIASDVFLLKDLEHQFDIVICHDVIEHIYDKVEFMNKCKSLLKNDGIIFMSFPAWQMPFGGHQQICRNRILSHLPFFHLLPTRFYKTILRWGNEKSECIQELLNIKQTKCPIETFENCIQKSRFHVVDMTPWFINPHYEVKFGLKPRRLNGFISRLPIIKNFFTTSSFYILSIDGSNR